MSDNVKIDILDVLNVLYEHGYTPQQALDKIYIRLMDEISSLNEQNDGEDEQITIKLVPKESHEIPLILNKEPFPFKVCLQKSDKIEEEN